MRSWIAPAVVVIIGLGLLAAGCAKEKPMDQAQETQPPQVTAQPAPAPGQPAEEMKPEAPAMTDLDAELRAFEDENIYFDFDRYNLKPEAVRVLDAKAAFLKAHPELRIQIEGHCDERGTSEYNLALGERRARSAQQYLVRVGIEQSRISAVSYGEERPFDPGHNEEAWAKNRRDHFVVTNK